MTDETPLLTARPEDIADALQHSLRYDGRRRIHDADDFMARLVAERLVAHLLRCGFVLMRKSGPQAPDSSHHPHPHRPSSPHALRPAPPHAPDGETAPSQDETG